MEGDFNGSVIAGKYRDLKYDQGNDVTEKVSG